MTPPLLTVIVTCFNEERSIIETLVDLKESISGITPDFEVRIFDDASTDGSTKKLQSFLASQCDPRFVLTCRDTNVGFIENVVEGACAANGRYFWVVGGDRTVPAEAMRAIVQKIGVADIVVPYVTNYAGRGMLRRILSTSYTLLVRVASGIKLKYYNGSSIYLASDFRREINTIRGFGYSAEILCRLISKGASFVEIAVAYREGQKQKSTAISKTHFIDVILLFFRLIYTRINADADFETDTTRTLNTTDTRKS